MTVRHLLRVGTHCNATRERFTLGGEHMRRKRNDFDKKFGTAIRLARVKRKVTQTQLGKALGVTFQQIQRYENGANAIASTQIPNLCRVLKTTPDDLFHVKCRRASPPQMSSLAARTALRLDRLDKKGRTAISAMLNALET
jgi:transcriptional regulator with XRE-family HTH domain